MTVEQTAAGEAAYQSALRMWQKMGLSQESRPTRESFSDTANLPGQAPSAPAPATAHVGTFFASSEPLVEPELDTDTRAALERMRGVVNAW